MRRKFSGSAIGAVAMMVAALIAQSSAYAQYQGGPMDGGATERKQQGFLIYQKALDTFHSGDNENTIKLCNLALNLDHSNKLVVHLKALAYSEAGDKENAIAAFRTALNIDYRFVQCRNNYGMFLKKTGNIKEAEQNFIECTRIDPKYPDAFYHLGEIYKEKGDLDMAIEFFETAIRLNPNYFDAQQDLGLALYARVMERMTSRNVDESLEALQRAARLAPDNPLIYYHIGMVCCADGKLDEAENMFRTSLSKDAKVAASHWELGRLRYLRGDPDRCITEIKLAQRISPVYTESKNYPKVDPMQLWNYLGDSYEVKEMYGDAADAFKEVASMEKNNKETLKRASELARKARSGGGKPKGKGTTFDPQEVQALISRGINQQEDGDINGAKESFQQAVTLNPASYEALQNLGAMLEASGDLNGAMNRYQQAMTLVPDFPGAIFNLAYCLEKAHLNADAGAMYQKFHEMAGRYPYDPRHIVALQQEDIRERARNQQMRKKGY